MRGAYRETSAFSFHAFTLFKGEGARIYRAPKKYRRTFWEEERQTQRARRQTQCAVCLGALPATRMRVVSSSLLTAPPKNKDGIPSSGAPRQLPPWGKPCIETCSEQLLLPIQDPSTWSLLQGSQKVSKNFLGRGAAGATGKTANEVRRLPWRLGATRSG